MNFFLFSKIKAVYNCETTIKKDKIIDRLSLF